jgi:hypothetical protein
MRVRGQRLIDPLAAVPGGVVDPQHHPAELVLRYIWPTCRRWSAKARCIRRVLLWPLLRLADCRLSNVLLGSKPEIRFRTAKTYRTSLPSRVPTTGRCPLTPQVACNVGTIGKRASSWLSKTISPAAAFFQRGDVLAGLNPLVGVATQEAVGGAVGTVPILEQKRCMAEREVRIPWVLNRWLANAACVPLARSSPCLAGPSLTQRLIASASLVGILPGAPWALRGRKPSRPRSR